MFRVRELHGHHITAHHSYAYSTFQEGYRRGDYTNKQTNKDWAMQYRIFQPSPDSPSLCRRSLAGGSVWDSLADLPKIMKLRGVGADDVKEVREIVLHLFTNIVQTAPSKRNRRQAKTRVKNLLFHLYVEHGLFPGSIPRNNIKGN